MKTSITAVLAAVALVAVAVVCAVPEGFASVAALPSHLDPAMLVTDPAATWQLVAGVGVGSLAKAKELREKRAKLVADAQVVLNEADAETDAAKKKEKLDRFDAMHSEVDQLKRQIDAHERAADMESELRDQRGNLLPNPGLSDDPKERIEQQKRALEAYVRFGYASLSDEARQILVPGKAAAAFLAEQMKHLRAFVREARDLSTGSSGAVLPNEYWSEIERNMLAFGGMREVARVIRTTNGNPFVLPTMDDTSNSAAIVAEAATSSTSVDPTLASLTLNAYTYRSFMKVSREMLQDASFDINGWVFGTEGLSVRLARGLNAHFTTGSGSSQPNGFVNAAGTTVALASGNSMAYDDFVNLEHAIDPSQRNNARFMFHDSVLKASKKIKDTQNNPIWMSGLAMRAPDTILGYPYQVNQSMAPLDSGGDKVVGFGNFQKYIIRDVVGDGFPVILRLEERFADAGQVGFFLFSRHDGDLLDPGTDPIAIGVTPSP
jgi:HK97 family phage major capsid protein